MKSDYHIALERSKVTVKPELRVKDFRLRQSKKCERWETQGSHC